MHLPKQEGRPIRDVTKLQRAPCRKGPHGEPDAIPEPEKSADSAAADYKTSNDGDKNKSSDRPALIIQGRKTSRLQSYPAKTRSVDETLQAFQSFFGPKTRPLHVYTHGGAEFKKDSQASHDTSTPHRPQTNGVVERAARRVKEGTNSTLAQSGLHDMWWGEAMTCPYFLRCVVDTLKTGESPWKARFVSNFPGPIYPFGSEVCNIHPPTRKILPGSLHLE